MSDWGRAWITLLTRDELEAAAEANPFPETTSEPRILHLWFLAREPAHPDLDALEDVRAATERYELRGAVLYLWAPDGIGRSKLAERAERAVGVDQADRTWNTGTLHPIIESTTRLHGQRPGHAQRPSSGGAPVNPWQV